MNNEPVAWMVDGVLFTSLGAALNISFDIEQPCIPLYTHPAKTLTDDPLVNFKPIWQEKPELTLTDEEIDSIGDEVSNLIDTYAGRREFARAILRKTQEK